MRPRGLQLFLAALAVLVFTSTGFAQGGGASVTGSINGRVADSSGAVLPGVTVTVTSPSMMGAQTSVTDANGTYRFPALPPGTYTINYELSGFNTLKRENIQIAMGFTATVNVELGVAALQETVTVTGDSPVIDTSNTRVQQNFKLEALQEIPNSRDMWSLLAVTPSVSMQRIDVGGNRAGTQTTYSAYGYSGQNRVLVEGINTTEGTSGAGFYTDYGSFEEVFLGTVGQGAEMPTPGVQSQMLGKSGGNKFQGEFYSDYETNGMICDNIDGNVPQQFMYNAVTNPSGIRDHSNETLKYRDTNINLGGPIKRDKVWWFFSYRNQKTSVGQPNFIGAAAGTPFDTKLWNPSGKVTYQINQNNKLIGYYQWGQKVQPNRLPSASFSYSDLGTTLTQTSGSWLYKGEWNGTINKNMYAEVRYGVFGYYFPLITNTDTALHEIVNSKLSQYFNGDQKEQTDRQRRQVTGAVTYFKDGMAGAHNFKVGGELLLESGWYGYTQVYSGNIRENIAQQRPAGEREHGGADRHLGRQPRRRSGRQSDQRRQGHDLRLVRHRSVDLQARDDESRPALRSLRRLDAGSAAARLYVPDRRRDPGGDVPRAALPEMELVRAAPRHHLRPVRHRQDRAQGQLRPLPLQPGRRRRQQRQHQSGVKNAHLRLDGHQDMRRLHPWRRHLRAG